MDERIATSAETLRKRFRKFMAGRTGARQARRALMDIIHGRGWLACVFGGTLRDIALRGASAQFRDIDVVVEGVSTDELATAFGHWPVKRNRFGGLRVVVDGVHFDVWPLHETWAWKSMGIGGAGSLYSSFERLPHTTFLTIEAIAIELFPRESGGRRIHERGFFESLRSRTIELNRPENPFPDLCVARALVTAARLEFTIGPKLVQFLLGTCETVSPLRIVEAQRKHYRHVFFDEKDLASILAQLRLADIAKPAHSFVVPMHRQLEFEFLRPEAIESFWLDQELVAIDLGT
jgi:hypothetical protein